MADGSRRTAILAAAKAEFGAHGYSGARVERIASTASVNKQLLFHYFDSKDGLYIAAVSALLADFPQPTPPGLTPSEALRWMAAELVRQVSASPGLVRVLADRTRRTATPLRIRFQSGCPRLPNRCVPSWLMVRRPGSSVTT